MLAITGHLMSWPTTDKKEQFAHARRLGTRRRLMAVNFNLS